MTSPKVTIDDIHESINALIEEVKGFANQTTVKEHSGLELVGKPATAYDVEKHIFGKMLGIGCLLMRQYFDECGDGNNGFRVEHCGHEMTRKVFQPINLLTVFGMLKVDRFLYYSTGIPGYSPTEDVTNLPSREASHFIQELTGRLGIRDTYEETADFLKYLFGTKISTHTVHEIVKELAVDHKDYAHVNVPQPAKPDETIQVVSFDGKGVPIVKQNVPKGPKRLKKGQKRNKKKEAIVGLEYVMAAKVRSAEDLSRSLVKPEEIPDDERKRLNPRIDRQVYYQASLLEGKDGVMEEIAQRCIKRQENTEQDLKTVCVIDGALSLFQAAKRQFGDVEIILDIIHVLERFWIAAHLFHKEGTEKAKDMVYDLLLRTLQGKIGRVIGGLRQRATKKKLSKAKQTKLEAVLKYLENHREQMHYDRYLREGMPIATGVVESACGHLVKDRMEKSGARWNLDGAESMLRLRSIFANGDWDDYLEWHRDQEHQRRYEQRYAS